jgi:hypothetical protein
VNNDTFCLSPIDAVLHRLVPPDDLSDNFRWWLWYASTKALVLPIKLHPTIGDRAFPVAAAYPHTFGAVLRQSS